MGIKSLPRHQKFMKLSKDQKSIIGFVAIFAGLTLVALAPEFFGKYLLGLAISAVGTFYFLGCSKR
jgi:hypothetical protein